jgi:hypothetical protein
MLIQPPQLWDNQALIVIVLIAVSFCVIYWRVAFRIIVIILIALVVLGIIAGLHGIHITR